MRRVVQLGCRPTKEKRNGVRSSRMLQTPSAYLLLILLERECAGRWLYEASVVICFVECVLQCFLIRAVSVACHCRRVKLKFRICLSHQVVDRGESVSIRA